MAPETDITATAKVTHVGDKYFLPIDESMLAKLDLKPGDRFEIDIYDNRLVITKHASG